MTGTGELLERCRMAGLELLVEGEMLHVDYRQAPPPDLIEELRRRKPAVMAALSRATGPVVLRDGRVMHRFRADEIPTQTSPDVVALLDKVRHLGVVLVADGMELYVVERWKGQLHRRTLQALKDNAGTAIAMLRGEHRARVALLPAEGVFAGGTAHR